MTIDFSVFKDALPYRGFTEQDWTVLSGLLQEIQVKAGANVFKENEKGNGFYWVRSGKVRISRQLMPEGKKTPQEQLLTLLTAGNIFGEMALVDRAPRSADANAENDSVLYHLSQSNYEKLQKEYPGTALRIQDVLARTLCTRIRAANRSFEVIYFLCT
jgi:CRP-like cAMP-binding protein